MTYKTKIVMKALAASLLASSASAMIEYDPNAPKIKYETKIMCLEAYGEDGVQTIYGKFCDESVNNKKNKRKLLSNKCAAGQVAVSTTRNVTAGEDFDIHIKKCNPVNDSDIQPTQL